MKNNIIGLQEKEILAQLAEEAAELAQAALKLRRVIDGTNPTPVTEDEARENLAEEMNDVLLCELLIGYNQDMSFIAHKLSRWIKRLGEKYEQEEKM